MKTIAIGLALLALAGCSPGFVNSDGGWTTYNEALHPQPLRTAQPANTAANDLLGARLRAQQADVARMQQDTDLARARNDAARLDLNQRQAAAAPRIEVLLRTYGACMRRNALAYALATTEAADIVASAAADTCDQERLAWSKARDDAGLVTAEKSPDFREAIQNAFRQRLMTFVVEARAKAALMPAPLSPLSKPAGIGI